MSCGPGKPGKGLFQTEFPPDVPIGCHLDEGRVFKIELAIVAGLVLFIIVLALIL